MDIVDSTYSHQKVPIQASRSEVRFLKVSKSSSPKDQGKLMPYRRSSVTCDCHIPFPKTVLDASSHITFRTIPQNMNEYRLWISKHMMNIQNCLQGPVVFIYRFSNFIMQNLLTKTSGLYKQVIQFHWSKPLYKDQWSPYTGFFTPTYHILLIWYQFDINYAYNCLQVTTKRMID